MIIKLADYGSLDNKPIYVNGMHVMCFYRDGEATHLVLSDSEVVRVCESPEEVAVMLNRL